MNGKPTRVCFLKNSCFAFKTRDRISGIVKIQSVASGHIPKIVQQLDDQGMGGQLTDVNVEII